MSGILHFFRRIPARDKIPTFIAATNGAGGSLTLPAHAAGDLILLAVDRHADNIIPSLPDTSWVSTAANGAVLTFAGTSIAMRLGWKIATSSSHSSGTWLNGQNLLAVVYRDVDQTNPVSLGAFINDTTATGTFPGLTLSAKRLIIGGSKLAAAGATAVFGKAPVETATQSLTAATSRPRPAAPRFGLKGKGTSA